MAGFNTPVVRSFIMVSVFVVALLCDKQWSLKNTIAIACLLILLTQPDQISSASFQLSFAAVISIGLFSSFYSWPENHTNQPHFQKITRWAQNGLLVSCAAMLGTLPLLLYHFNRFSPISPFSTLVVEPFLCFWSLLCGLAACIILPLSPWFSTVLLEIGSVGLTMVEHSVAWMAALPYSHIWLPTPTIFEIMLFCTMLLLISQVRKHLFYGIAAVCCLLILAGTVFISFSNNQSNPDSHVTFLDVGQGSSTVLKLPKGDCILIDCGKRSHTVQSSIGNRLAAPFLWSRRITRLEQIIITHPHADHYNGLFFIIKQFKPRVIWINGDGADNSQYGALMELALQEGAQIKVPKAGEVLFENKDVNLVNIANFHLENENVSNLSTNDKSLILRYQHGPTKVLFPGDISWNIERRIVSEGHDIRADILLAAHHGANDSNSKEFIEAVNPSYIVVSGKPPENFRPAQFGLAAEEVETINTHEHGTIFFCINEGTFSHQDNIAQ